MSHLIQATDGAGFTNPAAVAGYAASRASHNAVHPTLDGGIGVAYRVASLRSGTLSLVYQSRTAAWSAFTLLGRACPYIYSGPLSVMGMKFAVDGTLNIEQDREATDIWYVDVPYQEVAA